MSENTLIIEPHYFGSIEYFVMLTSYDKVIFEVKEHYRKQTYRNRTKILTASGVLPLSVPVQFSNRTAYEDVTIDYNQKWIKDHRKAIVSAYAKTPYFDFLMDDLITCWERKYKYLIELNAELLTICLRWLQIDMKYEYSTEYKKSYSKNYFDARNRLKAKISTDRRSISPVHPYVQNFGKTFVPNLSIVDAIMSTGTQVSEIIEKSK
ncbi:MAG: WbqC family protein [Cyclobacteriaceae bacterium]